MDSRGIIMNKNTINRGLYVLEIITGLVASSIVTILLSVWAFRTLIGITSGYDNMAQRIVATIIIMVATTVWVIGTNPSSIIRSAKRHYSNRVH